jgi:RNA polymerase sigma-70 factor (ECF subfamily)
MVTFSHESAASAAARDPDVQLMLKVRAGCQRSFEALLTKYEDRVRGVISHLMGGVTYSDDLTQEVFLRVYRARRTYVVGAKFSTWLFTIANNVVLNARRTLARRHEVSFERDPSFRDNPLDAFASTPRDASPVAAAETSEVRQIVRDCIDRLAERQKAAVVLCDLDGLSYTGVADAIGTSADAAKSLIHRGRSNLKQMLESHARRGNIL